MNWLPSKLGAEPKKIAMLGGLVVVLLGVWLYNSTQSGPSPAPAPAPKRVTRPPEGNDAPAPAVPGAPARVATPGPRVARRGAPGQGGMEDFRPSLKLKEGTDLSKIDPSIRQDLIAKLREVPGWSGGRNIFEFGLAPAPPPVPAPKIIPIYGPKQPPPEPPKPPPPPPPPPPPIPLKFYGYSGTVRNGARQAFFLDGDDIFVAGENDVIRSRYKIIRIGVNSAVVEDMNDKHQQTLPLVEELAG
jgi:hypothetical protein